MVLANNELETVLDLDVDTIKATVSLVMISMSNNVNKIPILKVHTHFNIWYFEHLMIVAELMMSSPLH